MTNKRSYFNFLIGKKILSKNLSTNLLGEHNVQNLTAVLSIIDDLGYKIKKSHILSFKGTKRRMNILGKLKKTIFIDDYAHHPTEIEKLINVISLYKKKNICLIIEPHRYTRLNDLYNEYLGVLKNINNLIAPISNFFSQFVNNKDSKEYYFYKKISNPKRNVNYFEKGDTEFMVWLRL